MTWRQLGHGGPTLSQIAYGTMRLVDDPDRPRPSELLLQLHDGGIDTHHSSSEYESYPLYRRALRVVGRTGRTIKHIVKLAEPSFDDVVFDADRLRSAIDQRLLELETDHLDVVQWMIRTPNPMCPRGPIEVLHNQRGDIAGVFEELKRSGKVGEFAIFPYTNRFARATQHELGPTALCTYLSLFERESSELVRIGRPFIALRPFAGATPDVVNAPESIYIEPDADRRYEAALRYPLLHPDVATTVVSVNRPQHVQLAIDVAQTAEPDLSAFGRWSERLDKRDSERPVVGDSFSTSAEVQVA